MKFAVDRSRWVNFNSPPSLGSTSLRNGKGNMCCLGFVCEQCGIPTEKMHYAAPEDLTEMFSLGQDSPLLDNIDFLLYGKDINSDLSDEAIDINDSQEYNRAEREAKLTALFAKHGYELEFTGVYPQDE